ncbi:MAG: 30S ribosomal protein S1 [Candidatus Marinimicrobia bacterium]|nr:30S ribosomal protein S1 [Candidatus Neomarinimicrobiota bacterium]
MAEVVKDTNIQSSDEKQVVETVDNYSTETITSGPLSEEVKVFDKDFLIDRKEDKYQKQKEEYESTIKDIKTHDRVMGTVTSITDTEVLVDVGYKSEGVLFRDEFKENELPKVGDEIEVVIDILEDEQTGRMYVSKKKADFIRVWDRIKEIEANDEIVEGTIQRRIKGGFVVDVMGVKCFLPGSQVDVNPVRDFDAHVGKTYEFKIVNLSELRKNVVLSRKVILEEALKEKREELLEEIQVGDVLEGRVKNITDFGVFIDLGGLDGLLHITDLSWGRVNHPREVVDLGQDIKVKVIDYDTEKKQVSLGLKQLEPHPWEGVEQKYPVDSVVEGKVVNITNYGAFIELEKGVEGLIHISEISWTKHIKHPTEVFTLGDIVEAKVLSIDADERKISLGYKQLEPDPWEEAEEKYQPGTVHKGTVKKIIPKGAFVELEEGIEGFVYIDDMSWTMNVRHPKQVVKTGQEIDVKVLKFSKKERKISLGIKQLEENPWPEIEDTYVEGAVVEGEVAKITNNLVVFNLDYGMDGIVPKNQFPKELRDDTEEKLDIGEKMQLKVLEMNKSEKKLVLSRSQAASKQDTEIDKYLDEQEDTSDKIEIPNEVIDRVKDAENKRAAEKKKADKKKKEKKAEKAEAAEKEAKEDKSKKSEEQEKSEKADKKETKTKAKSKKKSKQKKSKKEEKAETETEEKTEEKDTGKEDSKAEKKQKKKKSAKKSKKSTSKKKKKANKKAEDKSDAEEQSKDDS